MFTVSIMKLVIICLIAFCVGLFQAKPIQKHVELVEDMLLSKDQKEFYDELKNDRTRRAAMKDEYLWPNGIVYYTFNANLGEDGEKLANDSMKHWMDRTCLKFVKRTNQSYYADFQINGGCQAIVGYVKEAGQMISIGYARDDLCSNGSAIHEIGHAIGFYHEHERTDRDQYVTINTTNMINHPDVRLNFEKAPEDTLDSRNQSYDYNSIMHYSRTQGSRNGHPVLIPTNKTAEIGQRIGLSEGDITQTKLMYRCNDENESDFHYDETDKDEEEEESSSSGELRPGVILQ